METGDAVRRVTLGVASSEDLRRKAAEMTDVVVDLDPALAEGLTDGHRTAAEVHVLRGRAESLRGPRSGSRALVLAMRASELEQGLLSSAGLDRGAELLREMEHHAVTVAALDRWRYAQDLANRLIFD